jgi:hypothetical protein
MLLPADRPSEEPPAEASTSDEPELPDKPPLPAMPPSPDELTPFDPLVPPDVDGEPPVVLAPLAHAASIKAAHRSQR